MSQLINFKFKPSCIQKPYDMEIEEYGSNIWIKFCFAPVWDDLFKLDF